MDNKARHRKFFGIMQHDPRNNLPPFVHRLQISPGEMTLLENIRSLSEEAACNYTSTTSLAKKMHVSAPAISRMLRSLDARGLIERSPDPRDRRNARICVTASGLTFMASVHEKMDAFMERVLSHFTDEEFDTFCKLQIKWQQSLREEVEICKKHDEMRMKNRKE